MSCFNNYGQHGTQPTHNRDIFKVLISDVALSDPYCVFFKNDITVHTNVQTEVFSKRYITENISDLFIRIFSPTPPLSRFSASDLVHHSSSKLQMLLMPLHPLKWQWSLVRKNIFGETPRWSKLKNWQSQSSPFSTKNKPSNLIKSITKTGKRLCSIWNLPPAALIFYQQGSWKIDCMISDLLQIVNMSLFLGVFPQAMKTAVIKPLLRKRTVDTSVINN